MKWNAALRRTALSKPSEYNPLKRPERPALNKKPDLNGISFLILDCARSYIGSAEKGLRDFGARVFTAASLDEARSILSREVINVVLAALDTVDEGCLALVREYKGLHPESYFYLLTEEDYETVEPSIDEVGSVVDDYIGKPVDAERLARMVLTSLGRPSESGTSLAVMEPLVTKVKPYFLFRSSAMRRALSNIAEISASGQTVLVSGETGTGKELVARAVHLLSPRAANPFVPINCGAIPEGLIEGELFGHEKGAFTGAFRTKKGKFEAANKGTLFLDEIGDMPLSLQVRLLRVLEEERVYRVGAETPVPVNVRVIAATRVDLGKAVRDGLFREDLYYRLNVLRISLPPLRERVEDVSLLAVHFLDRAFSEMNRPAPYPVLSSETIYLLEHYPWKGNVRELRNIMTRVAVHLPSGAKYVFPLHIIPHLEDTVGTTHSPAGEKEGIFIPSGMTLSEAEDLILQETLKKTGGNRTKAAKLLGISLRTMRRKAKTGGL